MGATFMTSLHRVMSGKHESQIVVVLYLVDGGTMMNLRFSLDLFR